MRANGANEWRRADADVGSGFTDDHAGFNEMVVERLRREAEPLDECAVPISAWHLDQPGRRRDSSLVDEHARQPKVDEIRYQRDALHPLQRQASLRVGQQLEHRVEAKMLDA